MTDDTRPEVLATTAEGDSVTAEALDQRIGDEPLLCFLETDEQPEYLLRGRLLDVIDRTAPDSASDRRKRKVASHGSDLITIVTDRRVLIVLPRRDDVETLTVQFSKVTDVDMESAPGGNCRLRVFNDEKTYLIDSSRSDSDEVEATQAFGTDRARQVESASEGNSNDVMDTLERLADLHERGALSDEEYQRKKNELLDRL